MFGYKCYIYKKWQHLGKFQRRCDIGFLVSYSSKFKAYRVFNYATGLVEEIYDVEFDESNGFQGAHENLDDVGDELLREVMKNILVGDIKPKDDENDVQVIDLPSSSNVPQDDDKDERVENKDTHVSHDQMWHKLKMLMLHNLLLKWLIEEIHLYYKLKGPCWFW